MLSFENWVLQNHPEICREYIKDVTSRPFDHDDNTVYLPYQSTPRIGIDNELMTALNLKDELDQSKFSGKYVQEKDCNWSKCPHFDLIMFAKDLEVNICVAFKMNGWANLMSTVLAINPGRHELTYSQYTEILMRAASEGDMNVFLEPTQQAKIEDLAAEQVEYLENGPLNGERKYSTSSLRAMYDLDQGKTVSAFIIQRSKLGPKVACFLGQLVDGRWHKLQVEGDVPLYRRKDDETRNPPGYPSLRPIGHTEYRDCYGYIDLDDYIKEEA